MRYGKIFHEPKASEMSRSISHATSVVSMIAILIMAALKNACAQLIVRYEELVLWFVL